MRLIGDVHGLWHGYRQIIAGADSSIQLGDFGFAYESLKDVDAKRHRILLGNHENFPASKEFPHFLGDYGKHDKFFYVRGGFSVDYQYRTPGLDWFPEEEISWEIAEQAIELYKQEKPSFIISHECPASILREYTRPNTKWDQFGPSFTSQVLQMLLDIYQPVYWIFGYHHRNKTISYRGVEFIGLGELSWIDL